MLQFRGGMRKQLVGPWGGGGPRNTAAPAISAIAVIGTTITPTPGTWTGSPMLTYQWQRYTGGAWVDIGAATAINRAPVDADFGLALRLAEIPNGDAGQAAYSNSTGLTAEAPVQVWGSELLTNGNMEAGSPPSSWNANSSAVLLSAADERTGGGGSASLELERGAVDYPFASQSIAGVTGDFIELGGWMKKIDGGSLGLYLTNNGPLGPTSSLTWIYYLGLLRSPSTPPDVRLYMFPCSAGQSGRFDDVTAKKITLNTQLVAPSANMQITQLYTLPGSPKAGTTVWILPRVSDFAAGNYWLGLLQYTGAQWNINLYSVATNTATSRISATNIGASNGIRINMNGDQISLYTTADGGANWSQRGSTITNNTYQANTGVNALWTSDVTIGNLVYAGAV